MSALSRFFLGALVGLGPAPAIFAGASLQVEAQPASGRPGLQLPANPSATPPRLGYVAVRLAPGQPNLSVRKLTDTRLVLLAHVGAPGDYVGYRWKDGDLHGLRRPAGQQDRTASIAGSSWVTDMNADGLVVGAYTRALILSEPAPPWEQTNPNRRQAGAYWPPDAETAQTLPAPPGLRGANSGYRPYAVTANGEVWASSHEEFNFGTSFPQYASYHGIYAYHWSWPSVDAQARQEGNRWYAGDPVPFQTRAKNLAASSPNGQHRLERSLDLEITGVTTYIHWSYPPILDTISRDGAPVGFLLRNAPLGGINDSGRWIYSSGSGAGTLDSALYWSDHAGPGRYFGRGRPFAINNRHDVLAEHATQGVVLWRWQPGAADAADGAYRLLLPTVGQGKPRRTLTISPHYRHLNSEGIIAANVSVVEKTSFGSTIFQETYPALLVPGGFLADANRDGVITAAHESTPRIPADLIDDQTGFHWWSNDDDDNPGTDFEADYLNNVVDGEDDLADFFPVFLDIKQLMTVLPPGAAIKYKLRQADGGLNFVYTSLTRETAFDYLDAGTATTGYGPGADQAAADATTQQITADGIELSSAFLTRIKDEEQGVILVELRGMTAAPLRLVVEKDGTEIAEVAVNIAAVQMTWEAVGDNDNVSDNRLPFGTHLYAVNVYEPAGAWMPGKGSRIFPCRRSPNDSVARDVAKLKVRFSPDFAGRTVHARLFDVDDPIPHDFDHPPGEASPPVIDPNDIGGLPVGADNRGDTAGAGAFITTQAMTASAVISTGGQAEFVLRTSMQPGDNYRVAICLDNPAPLAGLQVSDSSAATYVPTDSDTMAIPGAMLSPLLTVWRKVHVEEDTMTQSPISGPERNFSDGHLISVAPVPGGAGQFHLALDAAPYFYHDSVNRFQNGDIYVDGHKFRVLESQGQQIGIVKIEDDPAGRMASLLARSTINPLTNRIEIDGEEIPFQLFDDDQRDAIETLKLPYDGTKKLLNEAVIAKFLPACIELVPAVGNTTPVIPFVTHADAPHSVGRDLVDSPNFWACRIIAAHEPIGLNVDDDPDTEPGDPEQGVTKYGDSLIFIEAVREEFRGLLAAQTPISNRVKERIGFLVAHEIGHNCNTDRPRYQAPAGGGLQSPDHGDGGLMDEGAPDGEFSALTIKRFRSAITWNRNDYDYD